MHYTKNGPRPCKSTNAALTTNHLPKKGDPWLPSIVPKRLAFTKLSPASTWPLLESSSTFKPCNKRDCSNQKRQSCSQVLRLNCKPNLTRNFLNTCTSLSLTIGAVTEKRNNDGKSTCAILTTYCFRPKNEKSNLRNNARNLGAKTKPLPRMIPITLIYTDQKSSVRTIFSL